MRLWETRQRKAEPGIVATRNGFAYAAHSLSHRNIGIMAASSEWTPAFDAHPHSRPGNLLVVSSLPLV